MIGVVGLYWGVTLISEMLMEGSGSQKAARQLDLPPAQGGESLPKQSGS